MSYLSNKTYETIIIPFNMLLCIDTVLENLYQQHKIRFPIELVDNFHPSVFCIGMSTGKPNGEVTPLEVISEIIQMSGKRVLVDWVDKYLNTLESYIKTLILDYFKDSVLSTKYEVQGFVSDGIVLRGRQYEFENKHHSRPR